MSNDLSWAVRPSVRPTKRLLTAMLGLALGGVATPALGVPTMPSASVCAMGCDFTEIQPALDAVFDDGLVTVAPGNYDAGLSVTRDVTIAGADRATTILDGTTVQVSPGVDAVVRSLTIRGAIPTQLVNAGNLTLRDVFVRNQGTPVNNPGAGGIDNSGSLVVYSSTIGGGGGDVGGINNSGELLVVNSQIRDGFATGVGALVNTGMATLRDTRVVDNESAFDGIRNDAGASLVIRGGEITGNGGQGPGALSNAGDAVLVDTIVANNQVDSISNSGSITLRRVAVSGWGSGITSNGGLINSGSAVIRDSSFDGSGVTFNVFRTPPAILNGSGGAMTITDSTIRRSPGGGVVNDGSLTIRSSLVARNTSNKDGAGIRNSGSLILRSSIIRRNRSDGSGGGIWNSGTAELTGTTVRRNTALDLPGTGIFGGGIANVLGGSITRVQSPVFLNTPDNCVGC